ncbi:MAG: zinc metalloprotease HtpX [Chloroflexi bacterium]|nr:zinc metalloprotease HtpX [Chloroflexota bacterium]|tara:strand:- start:341 stop:1270 length:930 start_codon:yes stop_codon:yes gene_type:complete
MVEKNNTFKVSRDKGLVSRMYFTWFLLGLLYAFFGLILNAFGVQISFIVVIVLGMGIFQYYMSDKMILWSTKAKVISREQDPQLFEIVERLAKRANIPSPKIAVMESSVPNAFATGRNPKNSLVAVTTGIRERLSSSELEAVLAHELGHVINGDMKVLAIANFFVTFTSFLMQMFFWNMLFGGMYGGNRRQNGGYIIVIYFITMLVYFIGQLLVLALTRYREYGADRTGSFLSGKPDELASALEKISGTISKIPTQDLRTVKTASAFMIIPALSGDDVAKLLSTHPPVQDRVRKLRKMRQEMNNIFSDS